MVHQERSLCTNSTVIQWHEEGCGWTVARFLRSIMKRYRQNGKTPFDFEHQLYSIAFWPRGSETENPESLDFCKHTHTHTTAQFCGKKTASRLSDKILKVAPLLIACYVAGWRFLWPWSGHFLFPEVSTSKFTFWYLEFGSEVGRTWVTTRSCNAFATYVWSKVMREFVSSLSNKYYNQARLSG